METFSITPNQLLYLSRNAQQKQSTTPFLYRTQKTQKFKRNPTKFDNLSSTPATVSGIRNRQDATTKPNSDAISYFTSQEAECQLKMHVFERTERSSPSPLYTPNNNLNKSFIDQKSQNSSFIQNKLLNNQVMKSFLQKDLTPLRQRNNVFSRNSALRSKTATTNKIHPYQLKNHNALLEDCFLTQANLKMHPFINIAENQKVSLTTQELINKSSLIEKQSQEREAQMKEVF